jgi:NADPH:quinone reductase-like Zn-dependent oxidoreductase
MQRLQHPESRALFRPLSQNFPNSSRRQRSRRFRGVWQSPDYQSQDFAATVSNIDVVLDTVGGVAHSKSYKVIRPGGVLVSIATFPDPESAKAHGVSATWMLHLSDGARLSLIAGLCNTGALKVPVDSTFSLQDFASALTRSASGRATGKILLRVSQS